MILVVDDNQENIFSLKSLLTLHRFEVDTAMSGAEALKKILVNSYALVILDVQMPEMDGFEVAEAITGYSKSKDVPIIFLSAVNTHKKFITKGYNSGAIDYVTKPFDPDILLLKIKTFYRLSEQTQQLNALEIALRKEIDLRKQAEVVLERKVIDRTKELSRINQRLELSNSELQQFAFVASHDMQEPLRKILTFSSLVLERHMDDEEKVRMYLNKIHRSAQRLRNLVTDILNYSRLNADELFVKTNFNTLIDEVLGDLIFTADGDGPLIRVASMPEIEVIPSLMRQVFQNLLSNSLKFRRKNVRCEITITGSPVEERSLVAPPSVDGDFYRIVYRDNGIGFSDDYSQKIFEIFQRLNVQDEYEGTGIGLAIIKKVIERHEGLISATGKEGQGAVFTIVLPVQHIVTQEPTEKAKSILS
jgi:signal transduction histidine kinase